jgi:hypothetical protein
MATTYQLISSQTLSTSAASVTFSSIPATYTDLVLRISARSDIAGLVNTIKLTYNSLAGTNYSYTLLYSNASNTSVSVQDSNQSTLRHGYYNGDTTTSDTFGSAEIYIPNYAGSTAKPSSSFSVSQNNGTSTGDWYISTYAGLSQSTAAITGITIASVDTANYKIGSSFDLYGIKNS